MVTQSQYFLVPSIEPTQVSVVDLLHVLFKEDAGDSLAYERMRLAEKEMINAIREYIPKLHQTF